MGPWVTRMFPLVAVFMVPAAAPAQEEAEENLLAFNSYCRQCHVTKGGDHRLGSQPP